MAIKGKFFTMQLKDDVVGEQYGPSEIEKVLKATEGLVMDHMKDAVPALKFGDAPKFTIPEYDGKPIPFPKFQKKLKEHVKEHKKITPTGGFQTFGSGIMDVYKTYFIKELNKTSALWEMGLSAEQKKCNQYFKDHPKAEKRIAGIEWFMRAQYKEWLLRRLLDSSNTANALDGPRLTILVEEYAAGYPDDDGGIEGCKAVYTGLTKEGMEIAKRWAYGYGEGTFPEWLIKVGLATPALEGVLQWVKY